MRGLIGSLLTAALAAIAVWMPISAWADEHIDVTTLPGAIGTHASARNNGQVSATVPISTASLPAGTWITIDSCALGGTATCSTFEQCPDGSTRQDRWYQTDSGEQLLESRFCPSDATAAARPVLTPGRVLEAFRRLPLPESPLLIEPSGGETIVNFDTIFYTTRGPLTRTVRLLGHRVRFSIEPSRFTWVWGDGGRAVTTSPGRPYRSGVPVGRDITHRYLTKDRFAPRLDTTYTATYSVDGGPARPVGGTVTIAGTPQELRTVTYTPLLVDD